MYNKETIDMKRRDWLREKSRQDYEDDLKDKCVRCGKWKVLDEHGTCGGCVEDDVDEEYDNVQS